MPCTEAYKEHIMYTFNGFCKTVIRFAAINAWRDRSRRRQKEIFLEYLTEEKFYPLGTTDEYFEAPYEEYPITICGQTIILTNGELAAALLSLPEINREIIFLYFFEDYTQQEIGEMYGRCRSTTGYQIRRTLKLLQRKIAAALAKSPLAALKVLTEAHTEEAATFLEQDSTTVPNFSNRSFCPMGILLGLPPQARLFAACAA